MDIWISKRNADGTYQNAVNATDINTKGNEVTPFYDVNAKKLFFSSDWLYGFGGYDIFETSGEFTQWQKPMNLMQPVNTPQNDLYYSVALDNSKAYITSNRKGSYFY
ncbi:MAG: PD40 domain-containing protein [Bacteroidetes bacterium]|nr:PD40 domain-containing protein [Bacteroidota bacterium]